MFAHTSELTEALHSAFDSKKGTYCLHTHYIKDDTPQYINRLILEDSPYLLQHAHQPVDWYPWCKEAFLDAEKHDKLVFLSIGYSTCHWCHVMANESFDNERIATLMNQYFVNIKVDRELHPDVDSYYMDACLLIQRQGGWPMSGFLTSSAKLFFAGTYYQPQQFISLLEHIANVWLQNSEQINTQASMITQQLLHQLSEKRVNQLRHPIIDQASQNMMQHYDTESGGFYGAPKFPNEPCWYFLLEYGRHQHNQDIIGALTHTLESVACGGIYDHLAGGFHRYATDTNWLIPHFEKMLYNQANLAFLFIEAYRIKNRLDFRHIACETLDYVLREMTDPSGGFYAATDADSEGVEGQFFIWSKQEIMELLGVTDEDIFIKLYQLTDQGNFLGKNILHLPMMLGRYATQNNLNYEVLYNKIREQKQILYAAREKRVKPFRDDKVITSWNGMMIRTLAYAGMCLNIEEYISAAQNAADYILKTHYLDIGCLSRASTNGIAKYDGLQEDYAYLAEGLLQLYDATRDPSYLQNASKLVDDMLEKFWDRQHGGFFMRKQNDAHLLPDSPKKSSDDATPSGDSVALNVLARLANRTDNRVYAMYSTKLIESHADQISYKPYLYHYFLYGFMQHTFGEQHHYRWCADGQIYVHVNRQAKSQQCYQLKIAIIFPEGWYLLASEQSPTLQPFEIELPEHCYVDSVDAPSAKPAVAGATETLIYDKSLEASVLFHTESPDGPDLFWCIVKLQPCNQQQCLQAQELRLFI